MSLGENPPSFEVSAGTSRPSTGYSDSQQHTVNANATQLNEPEQSEKSQQDGIPTKRPLVNIYTECELLASLTFFGIAGTMGRNGLVDLLRFEGLGSVWPNFTGCFVIALAPALSGPILNTCIGVGFCGAMTSFSEFITDIMMQATTPEVNWPDYGYGVPVFMARFLVELSCCFVAFASGTHFSEFWKAYGPRRLTKEQEVWIRRITGAVGIAAWIVCLVTAITSPNRSRWWPLSGLFAPFGVWLRYYLSKLNNPSTSKFKWGTFSANIFSTLVACVLQTCYLLPETSPLQRQFLLGLQRGFCGCLSTISTLIRELNTMRVGHAYFYGFSSFFIGYALAFIIIGSYRWTR